MINDVMVFDIDGVFFRKPEWSRLSSSLYLTNLPVCFPPAYHIILNVGQRHLVSARTPFRYGKLPCEAVSATDIPRHSYSSLLGFLVRKVFLFLRMWEDWHRSTGPETWIIPAYKMASITLSKPGALLMRWGATIRGESMAYLLPESGGATADWSGI
jgi:hypothetical protein